MGTRRLGQVEGTSMGSWREEGKYWTRIREVEEEVRRGRKWHWR